VITNTSVLWWTWLDVERRAGLFKKKIDLVQRFEHESLPRDCWVMWTAAAYGVELAAKPYCLVCGEAFVTAMPQLVQEAVDGPLGILSGQVLVRL
jgi:hypothetical protein